MMASQHRSRIAGLYYRLLALTRRLGFLGRELRPLAIAGKLNQRGDG